MAISLHPILEQGIKGVHNFLNITLKNCIRQPIPSPQNADIVDDRNCCKRTKGKTSNEKPKNGKYAIEILTLTYLHHSASKAIGNRKRKQHTSKQKKHVVFVY